MEICPCIYISIELTCEICIYTRCNITLKQITLPPRWNHWSNQSEVTETSDKIKTKLCKQVNWTTKTKSWVGQRGKVTEKMFISLSLRFKTGLSYKSLTMFYFNRLYYIVSWPLQNFDRDVGNHLGKFLAGNLAGQNLAEKLDIC